MLQFAFDLLLAINKQTYLVLVYDTISVHLFRKTSEIYLNFRLQKDLTTKKFLSLPASEFLFTH